MEDFIKSLGALKSSFDARDYQLVASTKNFPESFLLPKVPVKNQGQVNSCVAHAISTIVEYHHMRQHNEKVSFSTEFIYGFRDIGYYVGKGMSIRNALRTLQKYGDVTTSILPGNNEYQLAIENVNKNLEYYKDEAYNHRITSYFRINDNNAVKTALMDHGYVVVSMKWHKNASLVDDIYNAGGSEVLGNHAVVICGWNKDGWIVQNSWGDLWGKAGRFIVPFDFKFNEMWGITDNITSNIKRPKTGKVWEFVYKIWNAIVNKFAG